MLHERLVCLSALYIAAWAPAFAADPVPHVPSGGFAWGLAPGMGQPGTA
ncbi:hypothetical protein [Methylocapsa sp. S129]|nr:hypothetical protein [Methylocapsa sp. S129]